MIQTAWKIILLRQYRKARKGPDYVGMIAKECLANDLPVSYGLAVASRETGICNILGDSGHGRGVMQIDDRSHIIAQGGRWKTEPEALIRYGIKLLATNVARSKLLFPRLDYFQHLKVAAAAYNCGWKRIPEAVKSGDCDRFTTKKNYGADVVRRTAIFSGILESQK